MVELQRHLEDVKRDGYGQVAISYDSLETLKGFATQHTITFPLLSDAGSKTITAWGILNREATGRTAGIPHPGTFIIDRSGAIVSRSFEQPYQERRSATSLLDQLSGASPGQTAIVRGAHVRLAVKASDSVAALGHRITLSLLITPDPKNHVYAPGQKGYIPVSLTLTPDMRARATKGEVLTIKGALGYQACDDAVCHRPETLPVEWKVTLSPLVAR